MRNAEYLSKIPFVNFPDGLLLSRNENFTENQIAKLNEFPCKIH